MGINQAALREMEVEVRAIKPTEASFDHKAPIDIHSIIQSIHNNPCAWIMAQLLYDDLPQNSIQVFSFCLILLLLTLRPAIVLLHILSDLTFITTNLHGLDGNSEF
jgi:hypothetical protein